MLPDGNAGESIGLGGITDLIMTVTYTAMALALVVIVAGFSLARWQDAGRRGSTSGQVIGIVGRMGAGKTLTAVRMAQRRMKAGATVVSNFKLDADELRAQGCTGEWREFHGWEDFLDLRDAVVIIDEAHNYAPSHKHIAFPMAARWALSHARKHRLDVYWIAQHPERVNRTLRDLTALIVRPENMGGRWFTVTAWEVERYDKPKQHLWRQRFKRTDALTALYDTYEEIAPDEHALEGEMGADVMRSVRRGNGAQRAGGTTAPAPRLARGRARLGHAQTGHSEPSTAEGGSRSVPVELGPGALS